MTITLPQYCESHTLPFVYVYHIHGMDWCATNSYSFKTWFDSNTTDVMAYKKLLFGSVQNDGAVDEDYSAWDVKCIVNLDNNIGKQVIKYKRDKGISVGSWSVNVTGGELGYSWDHSDVECWGVMGLDCQPDITTPGAKSSILSRDFQPDSTTFIDALYWDKSRDNGLYAWMNIELNAGRVPYLWVGSSCIAIVGTPALSGGEYTVNAQACQFNAPLELVHAKSQSQLISITNFPQSIAGLTATVYGVPFNKEQDNIIGAVTEKPFILYTGKTKTNIKSDGQGRWKITAGGAMDQLKYESVASQTKAQLHGFHFSRNTPVNSTNYDTYGRAQQPHLWVLETNTSSINSSVISQGDFEAATISDWTPGTSSSMSTGAITPMFGSKYVRVICTAAATPAYIYQDALVVGQRYKIERGVARGDNSANPILKCGDSQVLWTGDTSTPWQKIPLMEFVAEDTELRLYTNGALATEETNWDDIRLSTATINTGELWLGNMSEGDSARYETLTEVKDAIIVELNRATAAGTLDCEYQLVDGDLVFASHTSDTYSVQIFGPAVFVCGLGYLDVSKYYEALGDMLEIGAPQWSLNRGNVWGDWTTWEENLLFENSFGVIDFGKVPYWCHIRELSDVGANSITETKGWLEYGVPLVGVQKNYSSCAYFYQWMFDETPYSWNGRHAAKVPEDDSGNHRFYYLNSSDSNFEAGDVINFGMTDDTSKSIYGTITAVSSVNNVNYMSLSYEAATGTTTAGFIMGMPESMQWLTGWKEAYDAGLMHPFSVNILGLADRDWSDPYQLEDKLDISSTNPIDVIKQLLGDQSTDVGVPRSVRCTDLNNIWGYHDGDRKLIDFDAFESLASSAGLDGAVYKLTVKQNTDDTTSLPETQTVNTLDIINGICLTHGIKQCWGYNEEQRAWWLTFKPYFGDSVANASNEGRTLDSTMEVNMKPTGQDGGQWLYSSLNLELQREDGGKEVFNVSKSVGRYKHSIGAKKLTIKDKLTTLPVSSDTAKNSVVNTLANYQNEFATVHYQQKVTAKLAALTRFVVGGGISVDLDHILYRPTGQRRYGSQYGNVESLTIDYGPQAKIMADVLTSAINRTGIGPSMYVDTYTRSGTTVSVTGLATTNDDSYFVSSKGGMTDLATFGCWSWSHANNGFAEKNCSCGNYEIWVIERNQETLTDAGASRNVWAATITQPTSTNLSSGTATISLDDSTNFPESSAGGREFVIIFADRDTTGLQPCQYELYGWLGDAAGTVTDSLGNVTQSIVIGG